MTAGTWTPPDGCATWPESQRLAYAAASLAWPGIPDRVVARLAEYLLRPDDPEALERLRLARAQHEAEAPEPADADPSEAEPARGPRVAYVGPRDLEALVEPLREALRRGDHTPLSVAPELEGLRQRVDEAGVTPVERRAVREAAAELLREAGIRGAHDLVREALRAGERVSAARDDAQGRALALVDPEPWEDHVDGTELLADIAGLVSRYVIAPDGAAELVALWVAHTYAMDAWEHTGYLALVSATPRCGKTTLLLIVERLAYRALRADDVSPAALYRVVEHASPTLLVDELDRVPRESDLWALVNSGHTRGGAVLRCAGESQEPRAFATWSAKVLAYVRGSRSDVPDTVEDRSVRVTMRRRARGEHCERLRSRALAAIAEPLRRRLMRWATDHGEALAAARPHVPEALDDRAADAWEPLLAVAELVGGPWPERARELAVSYSAERTADERDNPGVELLGDLRDLLQSGDLQADEYGLAAADMVRQLRALDGRPWRTWGRDSQGLTEHGLGRLLRPWTRSGQHGPRGRRVRRYDPAAILDAAERHAPEDTPPRAVQEKRSPAHTHSAAPASDSPVGSERVSASEPLTGGESGSVRAPCNGTPAPEPAPPSRVPGEDDDDPEPSTRPDRRGVV